MTKRIKLKCATCGDAFAHTPSAKGGKPPKHCKGCRRPRGEVRDVAGAKRRKKSRRDAKAAGAKASAVAHDELAIADLAAGMAIFGQDLVSAARYVGLAASGPELERMAELARATHAGVVEGEPAELGRRIMAGINLFVTAAVRQRNDIAPRDLPHVARAFSQVHAVMVGDKTPRFAHVQMMVIGADGKPFDPNAVPQPPINGEGEGG